MIDACLMHQTTPVAAAAATAAAAVFFSHVRWGNHGYSRLRYGSGGGREHGLFLRK